MSNVECGIIGLPNVGKSTLFQALTKKRVAAENYPFCTIDPNIGVVEVIDKRLDELAKISNSKKIVYATVSFVDIAGLVKGASKGEGLGNQFLGNIRQTDAILHVVRCFEDEKVTHVEGKIDPIRDIETINLELILADLQLAENANLKIEKQAKGKKEKLPLVNFMKKVISHLNHYNPLRTLELNEEETKFLKNYPFLTSKKVLYVANISEKEIMTKSDSLKKVQEYAQRENSGFISICAQLERELAGLEKGEAEEFLCTVGLEETGLDRLIRATFNLLDLITFITTGEKETKAWVIKKGTSAREAAGKIHSDIEKGFIRAEVVSYNAMINYKGRVGAKEGGVAKYVGKYYEVQDGDVILFFHS